MTEHASVASGKFQKKESTIFRNIARVEVTSEVITTTAVATAANTQCSAVCQVMKGSLVTSPR